MVNTDSNSAINEVLLSNKILLKMLRNNSKDYQIGGLTTLSEQIEKILATFPARNTLIADLGKNNKEINEVATILIAFLKEMEKRGITERDQLSLANAQINALIDELDVLKG